MRYLWLTVLLEGIFLLAGASPAKGNPPPKAVIVSLNPAGLPAPMPGPVSGPLKVTPGKIQVLKVDGAAGPVMWNVIQPIGPGGIKQSLVETAVIPKDGVIFGFMEGEAKAGSRKYPSEVLVVLSTSEGSGYVTVQALAIEGGSVKVVAEMVLSVVGPRPPPPDPKPDADPSPKPDEAPIAGDGLRVLVVYETADLAKMSPSQQAILYGKSTRDMLNEKCALDADGKTRAWRLWDADTDASSETKSWRDALARKRLSVPWVVVSNPAKGGFEGPLPADAEKFAELVKKYQ